MNWQDIVLERQLDEATLKGALGTAFGIAPQEISIVDSIEDAPTSASVIVQQTALKGEFCCLLSVYVSQSLANRNPIDVTRHLCSILNVRALISDESTNPYLMLLINGAKDVRRVTLDVESLDQREEYRLS